VTWRATLARDPGAGERHEARLLWSPLPMRATAVCETCSRRWTVVDAADGLAARVLGHAPSVTLRDQHGVVLGDGAEEQSAARESWNESWSSDDGSVRTVAEAVRGRVRDRAAEIRLFGDRHEEEEENVTQDEDRDDMSSRIRAQARAGSGLTQSAGARLAAAMRAEPRDDEAEEREAAEHALESARERSRRTRGLLTELPEEPEIVSVNDAIRGAVRARRRGMDDRYANRLFGDDAGGEE
jgi:hypothetical protein